MDDSGSVVLADVLANFARVLLRDYQVSDILNQLTGRVADVLPVTGAAVMLADEGGALHADMASDDVVRYLGSFEIELGSGPGVAAYQTGEQVLLADLASCESFPAFTAEALACGMRAVFGFPMWHDGRGVGALNLYSDNSGALSAEQIAAGQTLAEISTVYLLLARERGRAKVEEEELIRRAMTDPLTALPNRRRFLDHLELALLRSRRSGRPVTVLFVDLDHFKQINDVHGHAAGDRLLIEVAQRLRAAVRPNDTIARLGGDEFAVVCEELGEHAASTVAERVRLTIASRTGTLDPQEPISSSIGVATGTGATTDAATLLQRADTAMYRAKNNGRARTESFS